MIIYEGPNHSGTGEIVVIATGTESKSKNVKTGDMAQIWILPRHTLPTEACKSGEDALVCGDCPLRPANGGGCYVNVGQAPNAVWRKYRAGGHARTWEDNPFDKPVRIGAYGDIAEIPSYIVGWLLNLSTKGHTCYTAQWRTRPDLKDISMASVLSMWDMMDAVKDGWKVFRIVPEGGMALGCILCPATKPNSSIQCADCLICDGSKVNVYVEAHGSGKNKIHNRKEK